MSVQELIKFIFTQEPIYTNGDLKMVFSKSSTSLIDVNHHGWKFPSICKDSPPETGTGEVDECHRDKNKRLVISFEAFEISRRIYLRIEVLSKDSIRIMHDDYHRSGMILTRLKSDGN